jgi:hypothetical protein
VQTRFRLRATAVACVVIAAILGCRGLARAESYTPTTLTASDIIQKAKAAYGNLAPGKYTIVEHVAGGGMNTVSTTRIDGDDNVTVDVRGPFTSASGTYQGQSWAQNENGIVRLRSNFRRGVNLNTRAWRHPEDPLSNVHVLGITQTAPLQYVVEAYPKGGSDEFRYYNVATGLLEKTVRLGKDGYRHVGTLADYRTIFGLTTSFDDRYTDGRPQNDETETIVSFERSTQDVPMAIPTTRPLFALGTEPVTIPVRFTPYGVVVRLTFGTRGLDFILDSGADSLSLDPGVAHELGLPSYGRHTGTIGGDLDFSQTLVPDVSIGPLQMHDVAFTLAPHDHDTGDMRIVGLVGYDLLASSIARVDFPKQSLTFYSRDAFLSHSAGLLPIAAQIDDGVPRIPVTVEGVRGAFLLDSGAFASLMYKDYIAKLPDARREGIGRSFSAVGGTVSSSVYSVDNFIVGTFEFGSSQVLVPDGTTFDFPDYDGILGRDVMRNFAVYFDYGDRMIYLGRDP